MTGAGVLGVGAVGLAFWLVPLALAAWLAWRGVR